jgi:hypothetical protein
LGLFFLILFKQLFKPLLNHFHKLF